jgi:hypothetical protein
VEKSHEEFSEWSGNKRVTSYLCIKTKKCIFSPETKSSGRGAAEACQQARTKGTFWQRCINFLGDRTNYKAKDIIGKITNLFRVYVFQIDKFINTYIHMYIQFFYSLPN